MARSKQKATKVATYVKRLRKLAKHFRRNVDPGEFDMGEVLVNDRNMEETRHVAKDLLKHKCGAVGCLAGHAVAVFYKDVEWNKDGSIDALREAGKVLGLPVSSDGTCPLFYEWNLHTPEDAADRLDQVAELMEDGDLVAELMKRYEKIVNLPSVTVRKGTPTCVYRS